MAWRPAWSCHFGSSHLLIAHPPRPWLWGHNLQFLGPQLWNSWVTKLRHPSANLEKVPCLLAAYRWVVGVMHELRLVVVVVVVVVVSVVHFSVWWFFQNFWSNLGSKSKVAGFTLFGASWSDAQPASKTSSRWVQGSPPPEATAAVPLAQIENCVKRRELSEAETALRQNISQKGQGTKVLSSFFLYLKWNKWKCCWMLVLSPWGENAYYFAHNRHFEIPEDAKIISGPGLVTGGSPEKIQDSLIACELWG